MMLILTVDVLRQAYDYLNSTDPFRCWNLPPNEDVEFKVLKGKKNWGDYWGSGNRHRIRISSAKITNTTNLLMTMAHEMIHMHQHTNHVTGQTHGEAFQLLGREVCAIHGWDIEWF